MNNYSDELICFNSNLNAVCVQCVYLVGKKKKFRKKEEQF